MTNTNENTRAEVVEKLAGYGIKGAFLYLIDIIPLIEMIWADGKVQASEVDILDDFLINHVKKINGFAGFSVITNEEAKNFAQKYLDYRPDPALIKTLRKLFSGIHKSSKNETIKKELKNSLLAACIDIASSSVTNYPYSSGERFNPNEKLCFFEILDSFE